MSNIPRSKFCRLRKNCTTYTDYIAQCIILTDRFLDKGYDKEAVHQEGLTVPSQGNIKKEKPHTEIKVITQLHCNYKQMKKILIIRHWVFYYKIPS